MKKINEVLHGLKPVILMILVQFAYCGMNIFYKLAADDGMNLRVLVAYRWIFSTAFIGPIALIFERGKRPKLTWIVICQAFFAGLFGATAAQNLYVESLVLTSATFAAATSNLVPAVTLILATSFGLDKLKVRTMIGKAKVLGTLIGIGGAMLITFYKGVEIKIWSTNIHLLKHSHDDHLQKTHNITSNHILGSSMALGSCICYAMWLIIQTKMSKRYPCYNSSTALMSFMASIQCVALSLCMDRNWKEWKLGWNIRLLTVVYSGIVTSGLVVTLISWCVCMRGPVFVSIFNPLSVMLVAISGSLILEEKLHLGSILGAVLIVCGVYIVLWGQNKEIKENAKLVPTKSSPRTELVEVVSDGDQPTLNASTLEGSLQKEEQQEQQQPIEHKRV